LINKDEALAKGSFKVVCITDKMVVCPVSPVSRGLGKPERGFEA